MPRCAGAAPTVCFSVAGGQFVPWIASARWMSSAMCAAIAGQSSRGRLWPMPSKITRFAPGMAPRWLAHH
jgi:hypothetical protein